MDVQQENAVIEVTEQKAAGWSVAAATHVGRMRDCNEDAFHCDPAQGLFIVSDGMGGMNAGEIASGVIVKELPQMLADALAGGPRDPQSVRDSMATSVVEISRRVRQLGQRSAATSGMGATVAMVQVIGAHAHILHVGDSRVYLSRDGQIAPLTDDHTLAAWMLRRGMLSREALSGHPLRNCLLQSVGMPGPPDPTVTTCLLRPGDRLLLCSDGLTSMVPDADILAALRGSRILRNACRRLIEAALAAGGLDNITALVAHKVSA